MMKTLFIQRVTDILLGNESVSVDEFKAIKKVAQNEAEDIVAVSIETLFDTKRKLEKIERSIRISNDERSALEILKEKKGFHWINKIRGTIKNTEEQSEKSSEVELAAHYQNVIETMEKILSNIGINVEEELYKFEQVKKIEISLDYMYNKMDVLKSARLKEALSQSGDNDKAEII